MKLKHIIAASLCALCAAAANAQGKQPTIMVVPSDAWCKAKGYTQEFDNQGTVETISDFKAAVSSDIELNNVISKINTLMADKLFPIKDLQQTIKNISNLSAEDQLITSKSSGAEIVESPLDRLRRTAKADIIFEIGWEVFSNGPKYYVSYNLRALDAYTNKQVAGAEGKTKESYSADVADMLGMAAQDHMDRFVALLKDHFNDVEENGREITLDMKVFDSSSFDFEEEFGDKELVEVIDDWLSDNCVNHNFNKSDATETFILYEQVRMPMYNAKGQAQDAYGFARELARYLKSTHNITVKTVNRGLGRCLLVFGEK